MSDDALEEPLAEHADPDVDGWRRLPLRMALVPVVGQLLPLAPIVLVFFLFEAAPGRGLLLGLAAAMAFGVVREVSRVLVTRYRVGEERVELRTGLFTTSHLSIPRDRVRGVDVTARPLHRLLGLAVVSIGTGEQARAGETGDIRLDAIEAADAEQLRSALLERAEQDEAAIVDRAQYDEAGEPIATLQWRWLPWSIVSWWTLALPVVLIGSALQLLRAVGFDPLRDDELVRDTAERLLAVGLAVLVVTLAVAVLVVGIVARAATFIETWWGYQLRRQGPDQVQLRRGLLTRRSTSLQQERIRGVELLEPVLLRPFGVASARVVTTGLAESGGSATSAGSSALGPPAPRPEVERIVAAVLERPASPMSDVALARHPTSALRRRIVRALVATAAGSALLVMVHAEASGPFAGALPLLVVGMLFAAVSLAYAVDSWRALGHGIGHGHLLARRGSLTRRTVALQCTGIVGWTGSATYFQRRAGLMTLHATTAAGAGSYAVIDVAPSDAIALSESALPGLLPTEPASRGE